jgi:hypothetical protein
VTRLEKALEEGRERLEALAADQLRLRVELCAVPDSHAAAATAATAAVPVSHLPVVDFLRVPPSTAAFPAAPLGKWRADTWVNTHLAVAVGVRHSHSQTLLSQTQQGILTPPPSCPRRDRWRPSSAALLLREPHAEQRVARRGRRAHAGHHQRRCHSHAGALNPAAPEQSISSPFGARTYLHFNPLQSRKACVRINVASASVGRWWLHWLTPVHRGIATQQHGPPPLVWRAPAEGWRASRLGPITGGYGTPPAYTGTSPPTRGHLQSARGRSFPGKSRGRGVNAHLSAAAGG